MAATSHKQPGSGTADEPPGDDAAVAPKLLAQVP